MRSSSKVNWLSESLGHPHHLRIFHVMQHEIWDRASHSKLQNDLVYHMWDHMMPVWPINRLFVQTNLCLKPNKCNIRRLLRTESASLLGLPLTSGQVPRQVCPRASANAQHRTKMPSKIRSTIRISLNVQSCCWSIYPTRRNASFHYQLQLFRVENSSYYSIHLTFHKSPRVF
jgi:hypothetical protein